MQGRESTQLVVAARSQVGGNLSSARAIEGNTFRLFPQTCLCIVAILVATPFIEDKLGEPTVCRCVRDAPAKIIPCHRGPEICPSITGQK